jgi:hypothetical protein
LRENNSDDQTQPFHATFPFFILLKLGFSVSCCRAWEDRRRKKMCRAWA